MILYMYIQVVLCVIYDTMYVYTVMLGVIYDTMYVYTGYVVCNII